jgi:nucleoside-diphosphate-sugar epimerase
MSHLFCSGLGYSAQRVARGLAAQGWRIGGTARTPEAAAAIVALGYEALVFDGNAPGRGVASALATATHVLLSAPPDASGDPALRQHADDLARAPALQWIGYLSTVAVYGDAQGGWVDETMPADATSERGQRRIRAEQDWLALAARRNIRAQVFRLAGIYGPGRSAIERLREGTAHRIVKPGQVFNRIHVDDIASAVLAGIEGRGREQLYNVTDDEPAAPQDVVAYAAQLLHMPPPPETPFAAAQLSPMAASFYADNKRISNARLRQELGVTLKFPTYREGLRGILAAERCA